MRQDESKQIKRNVEDLKKKLKIKDKEVEPGTFINASKSLTKRQIAIRGLI